MKNTLLAIGIAFLLSTPAAGKDNNLGDLAWLELDPKTNAANWRIELSDDNRKMEIKPAWTKKEGEIEQKILGLLPKKSSSYVTAVNVLLSTLYRDKLYAHLTIYNFKGENELALQVMKEAEGKKMDIVYSMGSDTAQFFFESYRGTKIPVVAAITKDPVTMGWVKDYESGSGSNIAATSLNVHPNILKNYIFDLIPDVRNVVVLFESEHTQVRQTEVEPLAKVLDTNRAGNSINFIRLAVEDRANAKQTLEAKLPEVVSKLEKEDAGLRKSVFLITSSTTVFSNIRIINRYSKNIPVISLVPDIVQEGEDSALMAIGIDRRNNAQISSDYIVDILLGRAEAREMPVGVVFPPDVAISFLIAQKIGFQVPFRLFESAAFLYDYKGKTVRAFGERVKL